MYCSHCGTENENTAKFCRQCGNALQANAQSNSAPSAFEQEISASKGRQSVANFLRAFQAHVAPQAKNYSVLNAQCSQMEMLERQRADFEKRVKSPVLLILGIVLIALGIGLIASFVSYMQAHIDEAVHLYGLLHQLAFLAGKIKDRRDMENLIDTARRYGEIADQMFDRWSIPGRYLVFGDKADLARLKALELCELDAFYVDCEDDDMTGDVK